MNRDDVERMAGEAGWGKADSSQDCMACSFFDFECFAALVAAAEREACCKIVHGQCESDNVAQRTVDAIRARGEENKS